MTPLTSVLLRSATLALVPFIAMLLNSCSTVSTLSTTTAVKAVWKDPKYAAAPMRRIFVISLMKIEPGGRGAVEDALVAQLQRAGIDAVASHTLIPRDLAQTQPPLLDIIAKSGADGVLLARVKWMSAYEPYTVGETVTSPAPDRLGFADFLASEGADQPGDYKVARISTSVFQGSLGKQVWTAYTDSYNAGNLARVLPDYAVKVVAALAQDRIVAASATPKS